jgi:uncharacterized membrane protein (UPF0127 family)
MPARPEYRGAARLRRLAGITAVLLILSLVPVEHPGQAMRPSPALAQSASDCPQNTNSPDSLDADPTYVRITFMNLCGQPVSLAVTVAVTPDQQEQGLMNVAELPADQGELFDFASPTRPYEILTAFWMKDTLIPLSIAFIGRDGTVHEIQDMQAETLTPHVPLRPYLYAVETNQGWFARHGITGGSPVDLSAALALVGQSPTPYGGVSRALASAAPGAVVASAGGAALAAVRAAAG